MKKAFESPSDENNIAPLTKLTHKAWFQEIAVNLPGAFNMIQAVIDSMIDKK